MDRDITLFKFLSGSALVLMALLVLMTVYYFPHTKPLCTAEVKDWNAGVLTVVTCPDAKLGPQKHIAEFIPSALDLEAGH